MVLHIIFIILYCILQYYCKCDPTQINIFKHYVTKLLYNFYTVLV